MTAPFDINKVLEGQPVLTVSGNPVGRLKELKYPGNNTEYLSAMVNGVPHIWTFDGLNINGNPNDNLVMDTPIIYHWVPTDKIKDKKPKDLTGFTKIIIA